MYAIATNIVFFVAHVSAPLSEGSGIQRPIRILNTAIAARTQNEIGTERIRGRGYPEENIAIKAWILRREPRCPLRFSPVALRREQYFGMDRTTSLSARNIAVQSESLTRYAFPPIQCLAKAFFWSGLCTNTTLYGWALKPDGALRAKSRHLKAISTTVLLGYDASIVEVIFPSYL
jgi:hypothetical protein